MLDKKISLLGMEKSKIRVFEASAKLYPALFKLRHIIEDRFKEDLLKKPYFHHNIHYRVKKIKESKKEDDLLAMQIVDYVKKIFTKHGVDHFIEPIDGAVEYSWYHGKLPKSKMPFVIHEDDYGGVPFTVTTCIFYLEKTMDGADLEIYKSGFWSKKLVETIDVKPSSSKKVKIVLIEGNILHYINEIMSEGDRHAVVVQFRVLRQRGGGKKRSEQDCTVA